MAKQPRSAVQEQSVTTTLTISPDSSASVVVNSTLDVTVETNATTFNVESRNTENATVEKGEGKFTITGVKAGQATISVTAQADGGEEVTKELTVTVEAAEPEELPEASFTVSPESITLKINGTETITATGELDSIVVTSTNQTSLEVTSTSGLTASIRALSEGNGNLEIIGKKAGKKDKTIQIPFKVISNKTTIELNPSSDVSVTVGQTKNITVTTNASDFNVVSEDDQKLTVEKGSGKFTIRGVAEGNTNVKVDATVQDGEKKEVTLPVTITAAVVVPTEKPDTPVLTSSTKEVKSGKSLVLTVQEVDDVTFEASVQEGKGSTSVTGNNITFRAPTLASEETVQVTIKSKKGNQYCDTPLVVDVRVIVEPSLSFTVNPNPINIKEKETFIVNVEGDLDSIAARSTNMLTFVITNIGAKTITIQSLFAGTANLIVTGRKAGYKDTDLTVKVNITKDSIIDPGEDGEVTPGKLNDSEIKAILDKPEFDYKTDMKEIAVKSPLKYRSVIALMYSYNSENSPLAPLPSESKVAKNTYNLYFVLIDALNDVVKDTDKFNNFFTIVNKTFLTYKDEAYAYRYLVRSLELWLELKLIEDEKEIYTFKALADLIVKLADPATRDTNKANIRFDEVFAKDKHTLNSDLLNAIKTYYAF